MVLGSTLGLIFEFKLDSFEGFINEFSQIGQLNMPEGIAAEDIVSTARSVAGQLLVDCRLFDVYQGSGIDSGLKSVALGLILQESSRTLTDQEADQVVTAVGEALKSEFGAQIRD